MRRRLLAGFLSVTALVLLILEIPLGVNYARTEQSRLIADVERDATVLGSFAEDSLETTNGVNLSTLVQRYGAQTGARAIIVDAHGIMLADSAPTGSTDFSSRPEIKQALAGRVATGSRLSETLNTTLVFVAVPVASGGVVHGAIRITYPTGALGARILHNWLILGGIGLAILMAAGLIGWVVARSLARPVTDLEQAASAFASGHFGARAPEPRGVRELKSLTQAFNDMAARIEQLLATQRSFIADASHELRTPLTALQLRLENVRDLIGSDEERDIAGALRDVDRLRRIVDSLLALARMESGGVVREPVAVADALSDRARAWEALASQKGIALSVSAGEGAMCSVAPGSLEQILDNLISNAMEVAPQGSTIELSARRSKDEIVIHAIDHGPGMSEAERARAFDRFWRAGHSHGGGSGLGLSIVRQLVIANGGSVSLRETEGGGLDVVMSLHAAPNRAELGSNEVA